MSESLILSGVERHPEWSEPISLLRAIFWSNVNMTYVLDNNLIFKYIVYYYTTCTNFGV